MNEVLAVGIYRGGGKPIFYEFEGMQFLTSMWRGETFWVAQKGDKHFFLQHV